MPRRSEEDGAYARCDAADRLARFPELEEKQWRLSARFFSTDTKKEARIQGKWNAGLQRECDGMREEWEDEPPPNMQKGNYLPVSVVS